jgi:hypothetical protein
MGCQILQHSVVDGPCSVIEENIDSIRTFFGDGCGEVRLSAVVDAGVIAQLAATGDLFFGAGDRDGPATC